MPMTEEERFRFDLTGFLIRPAILTSEEITAIRDQIYHIRHDAESLPPEHRAVPSGPSSVLIDHPKVIEVLHEIIGPDIRLENSYCVWRQKGERMAIFTVADPNRQTLFWLSCQVWTDSRRDGARCLELTDVGKEDGGTHFIVGSHKANFPMHPDHMSLEPGKRSPFLMSYDCPAGSAVFFTETSATPDPHGNEKNRA